MNLLLDTHVWLWWLLGSEDLPPRFFDAINSPQNRVFVSAISLWEVNIKRQLGKLNVDGDIARVSVDLGLEFIPFTITHADQVLALPEIHKDPFDRALIAQAVCEDSTMLTMDGNIKSYPGLRLYPVES